MSAPRDQTTSERSSIHRNMSAKEQPIIEGESHHEGLSQTIKRNIQGQSTSRVERHDQDHNHRKTISVKRNPGGQHFLQFPGKLHTEGASILEAKRLLDEKDCSAVPSRTQHKAGPSKTMLTSLNTRVFNKEMQGKRKFMYANGIFMQ